MGEEQDAVAIDFQGVRIWKKSNEVNQDLKLDLEEFESPRSSKRNKEVQEEERKDPWLNQWSIAIHQGLFPVLFSRRAHSRGGEQFESDRRTEAIGWRAGLSTSHGCHSAVTKGKPSCIWANRSG